MANTPIHSMTDLWNSGGTTYYAIKMDVTNSASAAGSKLFAMQISSVNIFDIDKTGDVTITSVDAGAAVGPTLSLKRFSATPAAADVAGKLAFDGIDSAANVQNYADIFATITDPTSTSEDASLTFRNSVAGAMTTQAVITATGWNSMNIGATTPGTGAFTTLSATGAVSLTTALTVANGGTGVATLTGLVKGNGTSAFSAAVAGTDYYNPGGTDVAVADGGTGVSTHTAGILVGNGTSALISRVLTGTAAEITVTNGSGVSGAPTISLPTALTFTGKTVTGGTFTGITDIVVADGGTGVSTFTAGFVYGSGTTALATRVMTGTANEITVANGDGSGVPTWSLPTALTFTGKTVTGGTFSGPTISGSPSAAGATWSNLGAVTTVDINGGTVDGVVIGGASAAAGSFTTLSATGTSTLVAANLTGNLTISKAAPIISLTATGTGSNSTITENTAGLTYAADTANAVASSFHIFTVDGTQKFAVGASSATFSSGVSLTASGGGSLTGTWTNLGTVTTIDINGGTIDGTAIGGATPAAGAFTTISATGDISQNKATPTFTQTDTSSGSVNFIQSGATLLFSVDGANAVASSAVQFNVDGAARMSVNATSLRMLNGITLRFATYTVATLPAGSTGDTVFATDCRVFNGAGTQEGAGLGTGGLVTYNGAAWKIEGTNVTAVA